MQECHNSTRGVSARGSSESTPVSTGITL